MSKSQKQSSLNVYEGKWKLFCNWCKERSSDPLQATAPVVADFLIYLHENKGLALSTIEGYRTAISHTLKATKEIDLGKDANLSSLLANFAREKVKVKSSMPPWDLSLVLRKLQHAPFEPIHTADIKSITLKTVFLVALASGKRRSELHAMKKNILHTKGWSSVYIEPDPQFVAKTELNNKGSAMLKLVQIKALTKELPEEEIGDRALCPVRALRYYIKQTEDIRGDRKKLFIAYKKGYKEEIHMNTISSWIKKTILLAYENAGTEDHQITGVKAHQVRSLAASWALHTNGSLADIMSSCTWKSHNTFSEFYLKDMSLIRDEMYHLGPIVAASHISQTPFHR